jgi:hypothetical protein
MSGAPQEEALPKGHPSRFDYDPESTEAKAWDAAQRAKMHNLGTPPGYTFDPEKPHGGLIWELGVDPFRPDHEPFTGRPPRRRSSDGWKPGDPDRRKSKADEMKESD